MLHFNFVVFTFKVNNHRGVHREFVPRCEAVNVELCCSIQRQLNKNVQWKPDLSMLAHMALKMSFLATWTQPLIASWLQNFTLLQNDKSI